MRPDPDLPKILKALANHSLLEPDTERALLTLAQFGNVEAKRKICAHNLRFVIGVAMRYQGNGLPMLDLVNEGAIGMMKAAERYNLDSRFKFLTYAVWWVRQAIITAINDKAKTIRISSHHEASIRRIRKAPLRQVIGGAYLEDIDAEAARAKIQPEYLGFSLNAAMGGLSLDRPASEGPGTLAEIIPSETPQPDAGTEARERIDILNRLRGKLDPRQRQIITLFYGLDGNPSITLREIGERMNLSHERIRQIRDEAMKRMRALSRLYAP